MKSDVNVLYFRRTSSNLRKFLRKGIPNLRKSNKRKNPGGFGRRQNPICKAGETRLDEETKAVVSNTQSIRDVNDVCRDRKRGQGLRDRSSEINGAGLPKNSSRPSLLLTFNLTNFTIFSTPNT